MSDRVTHHVALWFQNDYGLYKGGQGYADDPEAFKEWAREILTYDMPKGLGLSVLLDLLNLVDWREVADSLRED